ncbi:MAG TPA: sigma-70 family RNA polymerase sigma factor [Pyrinomonadaceae bacterium]|nr:sigma-70 family RNA polymerase sigma factor [Pyrinomonadaceae bacterium]
MSETATKITELLHHAREGSKTALDELLPLVYDELKRIASKQLSAERPNHTLQATALVNEAYLLLVNQHSVDWQNRLHFFSIASEAMRRILVNYAKAKKAQKRGEGVTLLSLDEVVSFPNKQDIDLVVLDEAINQLAEMDEQQAKIVEMKFFGGLTNEEIAEFLNISISTVKREWVSARAWLLTRIKE